MFFPAIFAAKNQSLEYMSNIDQEHRITYKAGITRTPSDFLCQDGELAECINLTTDNEELKPIVGPAEQSINIGGGTVVYIHKFNAEDRYIKAVPTSGNSWKAAWYNGSTWKTLQYKKSGVLTDLVFESENKDYRVKSIGKTLIISDDKQLYYFIWESDGYEAYLDLPTPKMTFYMDAYSGHTMAHSSNKFGDALYKQDSVIHLKDQKLYNDLVVGLYEECRKSVFQKKMFCTPFLVRCALEMHDGTYTKLTNPVMIFPSVTSNHSADEWFIDGSFRMTVYGYGLRCFQEIDYTPFSDIVKGVVIFISNPVEIYDLLVDQTLKHLERGVDVIHDELNWQQIANDDLTYSALTKKEPEEIEKSLIESSIYYKLCTIGLKAKSADLRDYIETHTLENLTTQPRLPADDYYSNCSLKAGMIFPYNSRLNIANVSRDFFEGFGFFMPYVNEDPNTPNYYYFYTKIKTDYGEYWVKHTERSKFAQGLYYYYPDPRATHVTIYKKFTTGSSPLTCVLDADLTEHKGLNGAYYFAGMPPMHYEEPSVTVDPDKGYVISAGQIDSDMADNDKLEQIPNYIITSDVNNPFVFPKEGYNKVGTGKILAISTATMALSQDMFGKNPLIVFSESGVWGMSVDKTGLFDGVDPFTRDVIINPHNVIQTDGAVFFVTKRGLMVVTTNTTNDRGVHCVSERMNGVVFDYASKLASLASGSEWASIVSACQNTDTFQKYMCSDKCVIAYDYTENRLVITNPDYGFSYILNIDDGSISKVIMPSGITNVVNNYPDYLMQAGNKLYSFYEKKREEEDTERKVAFALTRPMKLSGPVSKASIRQLMNVGMWNETYGSMIKTKLYLSDDLQTWYEDQSRFGAAAKYYRLALFIKMLPSERLSGTIITSQERRTNNFR